MLGTLCVLLVVLAGLAIAKGGKKPKPPPDPVDTGVIYFNQDQVLREMDPDGTNKADVGVAGVPSEALHGSERWFLQLQAVAGESYPGGNPRQELYAVSESGTSVQLTSDATIEPNRPADSMAGVKWATDQEVVDGKVSFKALRWSGGEVVDWGVYVVPVDPDALTSHTPAAHGSGGSFLPIETSLRSDADNGEWINVDYDWSPDGDAIVYRDNPQGSPASGLLIATAATNWDSSQLTTDGSAPNWSPDGTLIAFMANGDILTIQPNGNGRTTILSSTTSRSGSRVTVHAPRWSPSGSHVIYLRLRWPKGSSIPSDGDVYRATSAGGDQTNLTGDTDDYCTPVRWRDE
jgi:hypothetical protein